MRFEIANDGIGAASLRDLLRASTKPLHNRVDASMAQLLRQKVDGYERFLEASARAVLPIERALGEADVGALLPDWPERRRTDALRRDLGALSIPVPELSPVNMPQLQDAAYKFGVLYVLEGSRLGARFILQSYLRDSEARRSQAFRYLSHGAGQSLWQSFLHQLEKSPATRRAPDSAVAGASAAFEKFIEAANLGD